MYSLLLFCLLYVVVVFCNYTICHNPSIPKFSLSRYVGQLIIILLYKNYFNEQNTPTNGACERTALYLQASTRASVCTTISRERGELPAKTSTDRVQRSKT